MKRFFLTMITIGVCGMMFAGDLNEKTKSTGANGAIIPQEQRLISTFYGSKASTNANNPCKGATIRICGIVNITLVPSNGSTFVVQQVKDAEGNTMSSNSYYVSAPIEDVKANIQLETLKMGGTCHEEVTK